MKTAKELWDKYKLIITDSMDEEYYVMHTSKFYEALAERDKEIIETIKNVLYEYPCDRYNIMLDIKQKLGVAK